MNRIDNINNCNCLIIIACVGDSVFRGMDITLALIENSLRTLRDVYRIVFNKVPMIDELRQFKNA